MEAEKMNTKFSIGLIVLSRCSLSFCNTLVGSGAFFFGSFGGSGVNGCR